MSNLYISKGYNTKKMTKLEASPFEYLWSYKPKIVPIDESFAKESMKETKAAIAPLKKKVLYFLAGELKAGQRSNENLLKKEMIVIDYDNLDINYTSLLNTIREKLQGIAFILYPSISNYVGEMGMRFRLVIDTSRPYTQQENENLLQNVIDHIGIPADNASKTWAQLMGLPTLNQLSPATLITKQEGAPLDVDSFLYEPTVKQEYTTLAAFEGELTHDVAIEMVKTYTDKVGDKLLDRNFYLNPYLNIKFAFETREIGWETVQECLTILAMGNENWERNNIEHFKRDTAPVTNGTPFASFFGWALSSSPESDFKGVGVDEKQQLLLSEKDLKYALIQRRKDELEKAQAEREEKGGKGRPPSILSPLQCALILQEYIEFCLFDSEENTRLAMYQPNEGTWTQNEMQLRRAIGWIEPKHNNKAASDVIYHIWKDAKIKPKTVSRYLIPVKNGVFNLKTKQLEPFTPDYVFTSKIATPYVEDPELPVIDSWSVESWMHSIACGDEQVIQLLWEVISDAINGNYSRRQSIWLVGDGSNGKGTYQQLLHNLIGSENIAPLKIDQFSKKFRLAMLLEKVCCIGDDVQAGVYIDDSSDFNSVVTADYVAVEIKNKSPFGAIFYLTVIQSTNGMPKVRNRSNGTYRRFIIVPFNANFEGNSDNWKIKDEFIKDQRVLSYVLHKAINMDFERFTVPDVSKKLLEEYKRENDPLVDFKENVFDLLDVKRIPFYVVYSLYKEFCKSNGFTPASKIRFSKEFDRLVGGKWENMNAKYRAGDLGSMDFTNLDIYVDFPTVGKSYQQYVRNDLKLLG